MTTDSPTTANRHDAPAAYSAVGAQPARVSARRGSQTKASFKTSEMMVFIVATIGVLLASYLVKATDGHGDYFQADKAWLYVVILSVGYMVSRGLAKAGSRRHDDA